jgi:hypothetical protein
VVCPAAFDTPFCSRFDLFQKTLLLPKTLLIVALVIDEVLDASQFIILSYEIIVRLMCFSAGHSPRCNRLPAAGCISSRFFILIKITQLSASSGLDE